MRHPIALLPFLLMTGVAQAQVLITELQPNPPGGGDEGEWIELHNTGTASVALGGWTLNDYVGTMPGGQSMTRWTFPAGAGLQAGQVILVARQAIAFATNNPGISASYELADGMDDPNVPNLTPAGGTTVIQLVNGATGDAVVLADGSGMPINAVEYGTVDRSVPGSPQSSVPPEGRSLLRVATTGSSNADFIVTANPSPGVGFTPVAGPIIAGVRGEPEHVGFASTVRVRTTITSSAPLRASGVEIRWATATSSAGAAGQDYVAVSMTSTQAASPYTFTFAGPANAVAAGLGFNDPQTFHDRYLRMYISAEDEQNRVSTEPPDADETAANTHYLQRNVMPASPSPIQSVRDQNTNQRLVWLNHSVTVRGTAVARPTVLSATAYDLPIVDASGFGVRAFFSQRMGQPPVEVGDVVEVVGTLSQFRGVAQIGGTGAVVTALGQRGPVETATLTISQVLADAERLESRLVYIRDVDFTQPRPRWPDQGSGGNVTISDGTGQVDIRVTSGNELFGAEAPQSGFHVVGVVGQFTAEQNGTMGGYQIFPRGAADIEAKAAPPPPDGGVVDSGGGGNPDASTAGRDAGGGTGEPPVAEDSGCSCSAGRTAQGFGLGGLALLGLLLALRRRGR